MAEGTSGATAEETAGVEPKPDFPCPATVVDNGLTVSDVIPSEGPTQFTAFDFVQTLTSSPAGTLGQAATDSTDPAGDPANGEADFYELLIPNLSQPLSKVKVGGKRVDVSDDTTKDPEARAEELVARIRRLMPPARAHDVELERINLGATILGRLRFPAEGTVASRVGPTTTAPKDELKKTLEADIEDLKVEISIRRLPKDGMARRVRMHRGGIGFLPGSLSFKPGSLSFKPGSLSFKLGNIPQPMNRPVSRLDNFLTYQWELATGRRPVPRPVRVAVLDTGIDGALLNSHPLFVGSLALDPWGGSPDGEMAPQDGVVDDVFGHGVHAAGIVRQRSPEASINHESVRTLGGRTSDAFELARDLPDVFGCEIVVFSFGTRAVDEDAVPALRAVVANLLAEGKVVVAAAGTDEDGTSGGMYPADFVFDTDELDPATSGRLIKVGAVDAAGKLLPGNRVKAPTWTDHGAEVNSFGVGIASAFPVGTFRVGDDGHPLTYNDGWARWTGTSFAAPRVAGAIAAEYAIPDSTLTAAEAADQVISRSADVDPTVDGDGDGEYDFRMVV